MQFFEKTGHMALGSRLRAFATTITDDAAAIYALYGAKFLPKWFPVFFVLAEEGEKPIMEIAEAIGHSQPSVTNIVKEMTLASLVKVNIKTKDKRRNLVGLSPKGKKLSESMKVQYADVGKAVEGIIGEASLNLWEALAEWEFLLEKRSLISRVKEQKKLRESADVEIVDYRPKFQATFRSLNMEWISKHFEVEEADLLALDNPKGYILDKGGKIFVAIYHGEPVGVCALLKMKNSPYDFELVKMAVAPSARGKNIGWLLGRKAIETARELGASKLYLESNTVLKAAINLYYKLGFKKISGQPTPYKRCNIQMELSLEG